MSDTSELIAQQILNASINKMNWKDVLYNVKVYGAKGDGVYDDTQAVQDAIDTAIFNGASLVYFPPGSYKVTALTYTSEIRFVGDNASFVGYVGIITQLGTPNAAFNVKDFGAVGDGIVDDTVAIQLTIDAAMDAGVSVYIPRGTFLVTSTLFMDNTSSGYFNDPRKIHLSGEGQCQTTIKYTGTGAALKLSGPLNGNLNSFMTYQQIKDIRFLGFYTAGTKGIQVDTCSFLHLQHVEIQGFDLGFYSEDMDNSSFTKCIIHFNNYGIQMQEKVPRNPLTSTRPNNINFYDCQIGGNLNWGGLFIGGSNVNFFGGDVQGNGLGGTDPTNTKFGLKFLDPAVQGAVACNLYGVFFESNIGIADLWLHTQTVSAFGITPCLYNVNGCIFNRSQNTWFSTYNILAAFDSTNFGAQRLVVKSCAFKNFNSTYTPDVGRPHLFFSIDARTTSNCSFFDNLQSGDLESVAGDRPMPLSVTTVGAIGEYKELAGTLSAALALPAGGTWEWSGYWVSNATSQVYHFTGTNAGISAGGTTILAAQVGYIAVARIRRIS